MQLMRLLPDYYENNKTMNLLQRILSEATNNLEAELSSTIKECFVSTASTLLSRYEKMYGLQVDILKDETYRKERILAKLVGVGTTTKEMLIETAASYSNGEVEVIEDNANHKFIIKFVGTKEMPGNMADLKLTIEEIKPAHLAVEYLYVYNSWDDISKMTWSTAESYTWNELRTVTD